MSMRYAALPLHWQRVFALDWESLCAGSKAIAAVIADRDGRILSEGRNRIGERTIPNPAAAHAETEAVRGLDTERYPDKHSYILYAGLEPCVMCMGTIVMGGIRRVEIAARDHFGGAMHLMQHSPFIRAKNMQVIWRDDGLGAVQRGMQTLRELLFNPDPDKLAQMLADFSLYDKVGVDAACALMQRGIFAHRAPDAYTAEEIFDMLAEGASL